MILGGTAAIAALAFLRPVCYVSSPLQPASIYLPPHTQEVQMRGFILTLLFTAAATPVLSQPIIINELYNSGGSDEWIELVVVQDQLDMRNRDLRDYTSGGSPQDPLTFLPVPLWSSLPAGTIILAAKPDALFQEDLDPSDHLIVVKVDNDELFDGTLFLFAGSSDAIQLRDSNGTHLFGVSWGLSNEGSLPAPRVHFSDASTSNTSASFEGGALSGLTEADQWIRNNAAPTPGAGNNILNTAWIEELRGTVSSVSPSKEQPPSFTLFRAYPNPFNGTATISFHLDETSDVVLKIYDSLGREVTTLLDRRMSPGTHRRQWDAGRMASGIYIFTLAAGDRRESGKVLLLR